MKRVLLWDPRFPASAPVGIVVSDAVAAAILADGTGAVVSTTVTGNAVIGGDKVPANAILGEDGNPLLNEDGSFLIQE